MARPEPTVWGIIWWLFSRWGNVNSFHDLAGAGLPSTRGRATRSVDRFLKDAVNRTGIFAGKEPMLCPDTDLDALTEQMIQSHMENAKIYLDSAALIFAHSILDEAVTACHRLMEGVDPAALHASNKKRGTTSADMPRRVEILLDACGYAGRETGVTDYVFDIGRLERLDQLRRDIVHGHKLGDPIGLTDGDLEFLRLTGTFALTAVTGKYLQRMTAEQFGTPPAPTTPTA